MDADHLELMTLVLTSSEALPAGQRARVYRALARLLTSPAEARELTALADSLVDLERRSLVVKSKILHKSTV